MASEFTALDFDVIQNDITAIKVDAEGINEAIASATKRMEALNESAPKRDVVIDAVVSKLSDVVRSIADVPDTLDDYIRSLKEKSESLEDATGHAVSGIANL